MKLLKKVWNFIWHDNSILSWIINIILAFLIVKFIVYPGFGFLLSTTHPVVAVVSGSMEHSNSLLSVVGFMPIIGNSNLEKWWSLNGKWYLENGFTFKDIKEWDFRNGFNKGDLMILKGSNCDNIEVGEVIVYNSNTQPIIHRVISKFSENEEYFFKTKGDNVNGIQGFEERISKEEIIGYSKYGKCSKAVFKIPWLGWVKIIFTELIGG